MSTQKDLSRVSWVISENRREDGAGHEHVRAITGTDHHPFHARSVVWLAPSTSSYALFATHWG